MNAAAPATAEEGIRHYRFLSGLALCILCFLIFQKHPGPRGQQAHLLLTIVMLLGGALGIFYRRPLGPLIVVLPLAANLVILRQAEEGFRLDVLDLALCMSALGYVASQYRLMTLRFPPPGVVARRPVPPLELIALLTQLPLFTLLAGAVWYMVSRQPGLQGMDANWTRFLILTWVLTLGTFAASQLFRQWRRRLMDSTTARVLLQDVLWHETRGEQRRLNRWLAWRKIRRERAR